jgi:phage antirepressor YoqD-like protein
MCRTLKQIGMNNNLYIQPELSVQTSKATISSLDLVKFINSNRDKSQSKLLHKDFLEKVLKVLGEELSGNFRSSYKDSMNREKPCYSFQKREACLLAMSYSYDLQAKVFDYMTELEQKVVTPKLPSSYLEALKALVNSEEEKLQLTTKLDEARPAIEFTQAVHDSINAITIEEFAKVLGTGRTKMFKWLKNYGYLKSDRLPFQKFIDNKYFKVIEKTYNEFKTQRFIAYTQTLITGRGQVAIQEKYLQTFQYLPLVTINFED